jgi:hypothetical protein
MSKRYGGCEDKMHLRLHLRLQGVGWLSNTCND